MRLVQVVRLIPIRITISYFVSYSTDFDKQLSNSRIFNFNLNTPLPINKTMYFPIYFPTLALAKLTEKSSFCRYS